MLELKNITKDFPGVRALSDASLTFRPGEIHALLGENGAGKSTLIKIICGIHTDYEGEVFLDGSSVRFHNYHQALAHGISVVNQEIQVIPEGSVAENILLDKLLSFRKRGGRLDWDRIYSTALGYMEMVGLDLKAETPIGPLSAAQKQLVQIAKALSAEANVLILDEPTSSITEHEAENLFRLLRKLRDQNKTIIFVSHKLEEIFALCDEVTVIRDGAVVGGDHVSNLDKDDIIEMMIGRCCSYEFLGNLDFDSGEELLRLEDFGKPGVVEGANLSLRRGEILGFYGLVGSGRTELARLIIGEDKPEHGRVLIRGEEVEIASPKQALYSHGIGYVSENRKEEGLFLDFTIERNMGITVWKKFVNRFSRRIDDRKIRGIEEGLVKKIQIKCTGLGQNVGNLSGGNQQKVSIAKWLAADCDILIIDEPTVGVDVGAKEYIHELIWDLAKNQNKAVILISSDLPEMIKLARRVMVFREKSIVGELDDINGRNELMEEDISRRIGNYLV